MSIDLKLNCDNSFVREFPGIVAEAPVSSKQTPDVLYALVRPTPVSKPELLAWSGEVARIVGLPEDLGDDSLKSKAAQIFSGNELLSGMEPFASRYGGHQFGHWAGQLGDGRAISLTEIINPQGERWEIQLKGAGVTPYSRHADGRAVLRSSLREYLCSEAMHQLGIPTTRALCCVLTGDPVVRDMLYDGNPAAEPGAITTRVAPSFLRFGHFEILAANKEVSHLRQLVHYAIRRHYREIAGDEITETTVLAWFREICLRTARLMVDWLRVGFVHGVMNTDNMSILGLTIDYGPYGWLDNYDPTWTPNTTDAQGRRYRYEQQPGIALWNLTRLAEALTLVVPDHEGLRDGLQQYRTHFERDYRVMRMEKIGLTDFGSPEDLDLMERLDLAMTSTEVDMTLFYRTLSDVVVMSAADADRMGYWDEFLSTCCYVTPVPIEVRGELIAWLKSFKARVGRETSHPGEIVRRMNQTNPIFVLRNYLVQQALDDLATGNHETLTALQTAMKRPYEDCPATRKLFARRPDWARNRPGCSSLSCSS